MSSAIGRALSNMKLHYKFGGVALALVISDPDLLENVPYVPSIITQLLELTRQNVKFHNDCLQAKELERKFELAFVELDKEETTK